MLLDRSLRRHFRHCYESSARLTSGFENIHLSPAITPLSEGLANSSTIYT